jgi:hypothetical protein
MIHPHHSHQRKAVCPEKEIEMKIRQARSLQVVPHLHQPHLIPDQNDRGHHHLHHQTLHAHPRPTSHIKDPKEERDPVTGGVERERKIEKKMKKKKNPKTRTRKRVRPR